MAKDETLKRLPPKPSKRVGCEDPVYFRNHGWLHWDRVEGMYYDSSTDLYVDKVFY
jgi:hypothetical protein